MKVTLIIFFIGFMTIAPSIYFGIKLFDGKVVEKPYETGLEYNKIKHIVEDNGFGITDIKTARKDGKIDISFKVTKKDGSKLDELAFFVSRPASNQGAVKLDVSLDRTGYSGSFESSEMGNFILEARAKVSGNGISFQKNFYTE